MTNKLNFLTDEDSDVLKDIQGNLIEKINNSKLYEKILEEKLRQKTKEEEELDKVRKAREILR